LQKPNTYIAKFQILQAKTETAATSSVLSDSNFLTSLIVDSPMRNYASKAIHKQISPKQCLNHLSWYFLVSVNSEIASEIHNCTSNCVKNKMLKYDWFLTALIYGLIGCFRSKLSNSTCLITNICNHTVEQPIKIEQFMPLANKLNYLAHPSQSRKLFKWAGWQLQIETLTGLVTYSDVLYNIAQYFYTLESWPFMYW